MKGKKVIGIAALVLAAVGIFATVFGTMGSSENVRAAGNEIVTRGVVDSLNQVPQTKKDLYDKGEEDTKQTLGTEENPFLILEVVPYEEYALFGYHISGCEPLDMEQMYGHTDAMALIKNMNTADVEQQKPAYFFPDEPEADSSAYDSDNIPVKTSSDGDKNKSLKGYYERVEEGKGFFTQDENGEITKTSNGNIIWHTICTTEMEKRYAEQTFVSAEEVSETILNSVGDRVYTERVNTEEDPVLITYGYYYYENRDNFLKNSLDLSDEDAKKYSIVVKTITPKELNANPDWVNYTDLCIFSGKEYYGNLHEIWKKYNCLEHTSTTDTYVKGFANNDISWKIAQKLFDRVSATKNYAAIIMGTSLYKPANGDEMWSGTTKDSVTLYAYDWNLKKTASTVGSGIRSNNNVYKLAVMLFSMDHDLFKSLYLTDENPLGKKLIDDNGNFLLREGDDQQYWSIYSFLTIPPVEQTGYINPYDYWTNNDAYGLWETHGILGNINDGNYNVRVDGHIYTFSDDNALTFDYTDTSQSQVPNSKFEDYQDYLNEYYDVKDGEANHAGTPSDAVRYILGDHTKDSNDKMTGTLNILDIEPSFDYKNGYSLKESYIRMMIPKFTGTIQIKHMTTAEFIGSAEDLNSTYDMIFMGLDCEAYYLKEQWTGSENAELPDWNDDAMDGKIYFHTGDQAIANLQDQAGKAKFGIDFLWSEAKKEAVNSRELRFPGNDITRLKQQELEEYLDAGLPVVAVPYLYNTDPVRIDQSSNICNYIEKARKEKKASLFTSSDSRGIYESVRKERASAEFLTWPTEYDGTTEYEGSPNIKNMKRLETDSSGRSILPFRFKVTDPENSLFQCRVYLDSDQDGKFSSEECYYESEVFYPGDEPTVKCKLSKLYVGIVQWRIEVCQVKSETVDGKKQYIDTGIRGTKTGCSVAKRTAGEKKKIRVLQIMPDAKMITGGLNLEKDNLFVKYYHSLEDYDITVDSITLEVFLQLFTKEDPFIYDFSKPIDFEDDEPNPKNLSDNTKTVEFLWNMVKVNGEWINKEYKTVTLSQSAVFNNYNMIIVGFGDYYHEVDIHNEYGATDFLKFYVDSGKSVLFTHDLTSMINMEKLNGYRQYGYSANTYLRDTMGMNRYKAVSSNLNKNEREQLLCYQEDQVYDTVTDLDGNALDANHGCTYYMTKHMVQEGTEQHIPYKYAPGFREYNDQTDMVSEVNQGQITQYPYKIGDMCTLKNKQGLWTTYRGFKVARTHGQYYQLNMEDPNVTVWYCLAEDITLHWGKGDSVVYGVSPNDAANNYYIYSKNNVFYSGVGNDIITGDMEAKLFINTMIAAYRASFMPPMVTVLNDDAVLTDVNDITYEIMKMDEYDLDGTGELISEDMIKVEFSPEEANGVSTKMQLSICYVDSKSDNDIEEEDYIPVIYRKDGTPLTAQKTKQGRYVYNLSMKDNMKEFYFYYPKEKLKNAAGRNVRFTITNDKTKVPGVTTLNMETRALFVLD